MTPREFELLSHLMRHAGKACRRKTILEEAWDDRGLTHTSVLDTYINRLRAKVDASFETQLIHTVHGVGYMMKS